MSRSRDAAESLIAMTAAMLAGLAATHLARRAWRATTHEEPPLDPSSSETTWTRALLWAISVGAVVGVAQASARRAASEVVRRR